jgi:hypothetical protein
MRRSYGVSGAERPYTSDVKEIGKREETQGLEALEPSGEECELCGTEMFGLHCKLICPNCGYRRDCSDP